MKTEGEFRYTNGAVINWNIKNERKDLVSRHEAEHMYLYNSTTFGMLILMLEKNRDFHEKSEWLHKELHLYMNRMQERIAVNIENLDTYAQKGESAFAEAIDDLKNRNRTYYNYFRKLCCINGRVHSEEDAFEAINILHGLGVLALNINLDDIPFEEMNSSKDLQRFLGQQDNAQKYIPNIRFDNLVDALFRGNVKLDKLETVIKGTINAEIDDLDQIKKIAENKASKIISDSIIYERLLQRISTVGTYRMKISGENIEHLLNMPIDLDRKEKANFVNENIEDFIDRLKKEQYKESIVFLPHSMGGFEDLHMISMLDEKSKKSYCTAVLNEEIFLQAINQIPQHLVFIQTKLFGNLKSRIMGLAQRLPIFIVLENSIYYGLEFIKENFKYGYYTYLKKENYDTLVVWRRNYIFIAFIMQNAKKNLDNIFSEYGLNYLPYEEATIDKEKVEQVTEVSMENMILSKNYVEHTRRN